MPVTELSLAKRNLEKLEDNPYPGRGIVMGRTVSGDLIQIYWVMGRSENSRNRVLEQDGDTVRTAPFDASKVEDPSLIIYNAMREYHGIHVVSNGDQTDTAMNKFLEFGASPDVFREAMRSRSYEPDAPNYTPRISGYTNPGANHSIFWLTRKLDLYSKETIHSSFTDYRTPSSHDGFYSPVKGIGRVIHTYRGDGDPLPSFEGRPYKVPIGEGLEDSAHMFWDTLNPDNRVALAAKTIPSLDRHSGYQVHIINRLQLPVST